MRASSLAGVVCALAVVGCGGGGGGGGTKVSCTDCVLADPSGTWTSAAGAVDVTAGSSSCTATMTVHVLEPTSGMKADTTATLHYYAVENMVSGCGAPTNNQKYGSSSHPCTGTIDTSTDPATVTLDDCEVINGVQSSCDTGDSGGVDAHPAAGTATLAFDGTTGTLSWPAIQYTWNSGCVTPGLGVELDAFTAAP